jgi:hypothetical protein
MHGARLRLSPAVGGRRRGSPRRPQGQLLASALLVAGPVNEEKDSGLLVPTIRQVVRKSRPS